MKATARVLVFVLFSMPALAALSEERISFEYPLYEACNATFEKVHSHLSRLPDFQSKYQHSETLFDVSPKGRSGSIGIGVISVPADTKLQIPSDSALAKISVFEYIRIHVSGAYRECLPNNAFSIGGSQAEHIKARAGTEFRGKIENGIVWIAFNDGSYVYPDVRP